MQQLIISGATYPQFLDDVRAIVRHELAQREPQADSPQADAESSDDLLTVKEVAKLTKSCEQTVHYRATKGYFKRYKLGGRTVFKRSEVLAALQAPGRADGRRSKARRTKK
ncbi:helix-turn-helix transcriptional regulator [Hymenobacter sp. CRA2]|uniref:helix-turn-helix transcriptional regulator n=1 Tax=Hymenobacter sp. CRA2 TaxID=1955620 RepID=UPI00098EC260|nr:helix-turn-helix domain-containing protein [Hymenobacter sp. CRA2]OON66247.1 hypothetical protein B0919_22440 [Hymenobacter sp. CRA2]